MAVTTRRDGLLKLLKSKGVEAAEGKEVVRMPPESLTLITDPHSPLYDPRVTWPIDEMIVDDICQRGVHTPIFVRRNGEDREGRPIIQVITGRGRTRHALAANRRITERAEQVKTKIPLPDDMLIRAPLTPVLVPVIEVVGSDAEMLLLMLSENGNRTPETLHSRAVKAKNAIAAGCSEADVAAAASVSVRVLGQILDYENLDHAVRTAIDSDQIPLGAISTFARVPREEQADTLKRVLASGATKNHQIRDCVRQIRNGGEPRLHSDRKKSWGRPEYELFRSKIAEKREDPLVGFGVKLLDAFVASAVFGKREGLDEFPELKTVFEATMSEIASKARRSALAKRKRNGQASIEVSVPLAD